MKLVLSQEQQELRAAVRSFLAAASPLPEVRGESDGYDREVYARLNGELGLSGLIVPEEYGGAGRRATPSWPSRWRRPGAALLPGPVPGHRVRHDRADPGAGQGAADRHRRRRTTAIAATRRRPDASRSTG